MVAATERMYLVYDANGAHLVYSGGDAGEMEALCAQIAVGYAGYVAGYQFVGLQRYELRAYYEREPSAEFMLGHRHGGLYDFAWYPRRSVPD